jgi:hypothetical protein
VCNLYSVTKGQAAIVALTRAMRDTTGSDKYLSNLKMLVGKLRAFAGNPKLPIVVGADLSTSRS